MIPSRRQSLAPGDLHQTAGGAGSVAVMATAGLASALGRLVPRAGAAVVRAGGCAAVVPAALSLARRSG